ncbi:MAG: hypothetical protein SFV81_17415 [Pirellulaceae bacterium]|nr:hypothetical protein [Pirellulaceae bacterium]
MSFDDAGSTILSMLFGVAQYDAEIRRQQLDRFACQYTQPLVDYLSQKNKLSTHEASDLVQGFWLAKLIQPDPSANLVAAYLLTQRHQSQPESNSFRKYLLRSLSNYFLDYARRKQTIVSIDEMQGFEPVSEADYQVFDNVWANALLRTVVDRVLEECSTNDQQAMWELFCRQIVLPNLTGQKPPGYALLASELGYADARTAGNAVRTVIRKFQSHLRLCIRDYLPVNSIAESDHGVETELASIIELLSRPGGLAKEMFDDIIESKWTQPSSEIPQSSFIDLDTKKSAFLVGPEHSLYSTDEDIAFRWQQILVKPIFEWLQEAGETLERIDGKFSDLAQRSTLPENVLQRIRNVAKRLARDPGDEPQVVLAAIYMLAIASCYQNQGKLLTADPPAKIRLRIDQIVRCNWLDQPTKSYLNEFALALVGQ